MSLLFDSTRIAWVNELGIGGPHPPHPHSPGVRGLLPGLLQDRPLHQLAKGTSMKNYLVSMAKAMGVMPSANGMNNIVGDPNFRTGPLTGLTA